MMISLGLCPLSGTGAPAADDRSGRTAAANRGNSSTSAEESVVSLNFSLLGKGECVFDVDTEIPNGAFDLCMAEQS
jgi:hypothetical protein